MLFLLGVRGPPRQAESARGRMGRKDVCEWTGRIAEGIKSTLSEEDISQRVMKGVAKSYQS